MPEYMSRQLKAVMFLEDISEGIPARQENGFTIQHFEYSCFRSRDKAGMPYGPSNASLMQITLRTISSDGYKELYQRLNSMEQYAFSLIFNASYNDSRILQDYEDAMIANGYVVEIEELFDTSDIQHNGMTLNMKILLHSLDYIGSKMEKRLFVNN